MKTWMKRFSEPSTYAGLAGIVFLFGYTEQQFSLYTNALAGVCSFVAMVLGENEGGV